MIKAALPEPVAVAFLAECGNVAYTAHLEGPYKRLRELSMGGRRGASLSLITTEQAEAYANARVREALEQAAQACESRIRTGDPGIDTTEVDIEAVACAAAIRALLPSTPARPESEQ